MTSHTQPTYEASLIGAFGEPMARFVRGKGCYLFDEDDNAFLDFLAGIAVNSLGHSHPSLNKAIAQQAQQLIHVSNFFETPPQVEAASAVREIVVGASQITGDTTIAKARKLAYDTSRVFFTNSGTESTEAAFKIVRVSHDKTKQRIIALTHCFHGRSLGALSATWKPQYREPFAPLPFDVTFIEPTKEALEQAWGSDVAAVIVEVIQGEAGVIPIDHDFLWELRHRCTNDDAMLIVDEVQTGIARTGHWMAHHMLDDPDSQDRGAFIPDLVTLAKGMGGGVPVGAVVACTPKAVDALKPGLHGTTFGGNPLATAAVTAVIKTIAANDLLDNVKEQGRYLREQLRQCGQPVSEVRGEGLLIGIDVAKDAPALVRAGLRHGLVMNATGPRTIRLAPPLIVGRQECDDFLGRWNTVIKEGVC
ncbi:MAG: aminotransferase class III-fold pyridoxal phosphate-dependent enzyme [Actinomycetaceae bacterium]|nr:aminotransferase class III-fold pyridoxal phosphate-dependent enzyme [Actinomycetaceae bacterium]